MTRRPAGLPRSERIRKRRDYLRVQQGGRKLSTPSFLVFVTVVPPPEAGAAVGPARFGVTVTKKVGGAVVRNRIKRLVREAVRRHKLWFPRGREVVFVAKRPAPELRYADVIRELEQLCTRFFART
jgi:ribonuclease P protein component